MTKSQGMLQDQDIERGFNRLYRKHRLAARAAGRPFPSYADARRHLVVVAKEMRSNGVVVVDVSEFWHGVFDVWELRRIG
jgi:hypothetical protein